MKKSLVVLALAAMFSPMVAQAEAGDWVVRARAVNISPNEDSELGKTVNKNVAPVMSNGAELKVDSNTILEFDISYYITKNIAAELILSILVQPLAVLNLTSVSKSMYFTSALINQPSLRLISTPACKAYPQLSLSTLISVPANGPCLTSSFLSKNLE